MGSLPYDKSGLAAAAFRPSLYPLPGQYGPYGSLGMEQLAAWHQASMYQQRAHNPYSLPLTSSSLTNPSRFSPSLPPHHPGFPFHQIPPHHLPHVKAEYDRPPGLMHPDDKDSHSPKKKEPHIKKPLNAFMLYMKEMRPVVQAECTLKESAAINQILGRRVSIFFLLSLFFSALSYFVLIRSHRFLALIDFVPPRFNTKKMNFSGTALPEKNRPNITKKRGRSVKGTCKCTLTGTHGTTTDTDRKKRNENETKQTIQVTMIFSY